jgi:hypothetical protein
MFARSIETLLPNLRRSEAVTVEAEALKSAALAARSRSIVVHIA